MWDGLKVLAGWTAAMAFAWWFFWRPLQDAPDWAKALGGGLFFIGLYTFATLDQLKKQLNAQGEVMWRIKSRVDPSEFD